MPCAVRRGVLFDATQTDAMYDAAFKPYGNGYNSASSFTTTAGLSRRVGFTEPLHRLLELLAKCRTTTRGCFGGPAVFLGVFGTITPAKKSR